LRKNSNLCENDKHEATSYSVLHVMVVKKGVVKYVILELLFR